MQRNRLSQHVCINKLTQRTHFAQLISKAWILHQAQLAYQQTILNSVSSFLCFIFHKVISLQLPGLSHHFPFIYNFFTPVFSPSCFQRQPILLIFSRCLHKLQFFQFLFFIPHVSILILLTETFHQPASFYMVLPSTTFFKTPTDLFSPIFAIAVSQSLLLSSNQRNGRRKNAPSNRILLFFFTSCR